MSLKISQKSLDRWFRVGISIKGLDGILEACGGLLLLIVPLDKIRGLVATLALYEIQSDKHAFIANYILRLDQKIDSHVQLFAALYLLGHGLIKIFLAVALLKRYYKLYPYAIGFLLAFIFYQTYRIGYDHSVSLTLLTIFDCAIAGLTFLEWRRHRNAHGLPVD